MRWRKFAGFAAGLILAASSTVVAQSGPTFPIVSPLPVSGESTTASGSTVDPGKARTNGNDAMDILLPGSEPGAGR
jgi:hypothetical protein